MDELVSSVHLETPFLDKKQPSYASSCSSARKWVILSISVLLAALFSIRSLPAHLKSRSQTLSAHSQNLLESADTLRYPKTAHDHARYARWLVHNSDYGVVSTQSALEGGRAFGQVLSISDGAPGGSTGRIIFYIATISQFVADARSESHATLTLSEEQVKGAPGCTIDPEWPTCARVTIVGKLEELRNSEIGEAAAMMFSRHPHMREWSQLMHKWVFYELDVEKAYILDFFGGYHLVPRSDYYSASPERPTII